MLSEGMANHAALRQYLLEISEEATGRLLVCCVPCEGELMPGREDMDVPTPAALAGMFSHASDPAVSPRFRATVCGSRSAKASESCGVPLTSGAAVQLFKS